MNELDKHYSNNHQAWTNLIS